VGLGAKKIGSPMHDLVQAVQLLGKKFKAIPSPREFTKRRGNRKKTAGFAQVSTRSIPHELIHWENKVPQPDALRSTLIRKHKGQATEHPVKSTHPTLEGGSFAIPRDFLFGM
jgi:hypothetical protein